MQEVNVVTVRKANIERIRRHPSDIILLLHSTEIDGVTPMSEHPTDNDIEQEPLARPTRRAKSECNKKISDLSSGRFDMNAEV